MHSVHFGSMRKVRPYFGNNGEEIKACDDAGITVTLPKPMTSGAKSADRFGKQDFIYKAQEDLYVCPAGEKLTKCQSLRARGVRAQRSLIDPLVDLGGKVGRQ
jgi:hypothetical protein